jgi:hypothetical protein
MSLLFRKSALLLGILLVTGTSWSVNPPQPLPNIRRLTRQSGYIFTGTVTAVERKLSAGSVPTMKITFRVQEAIRGVVKGQTFVLNEWAGVWEAGESYHRGERVLLFLYRPGKLGLTSPVGGQQGRFKLDSDGMAVLRREQAAVWFPARISDVKAPGVSRMRIAEFARAVHQMEQE